MRFKKLMVVGTAALAVLGLVTGAALASSRGTKAPDKPAISVAKTADTDNIQEGDQTSPDNPNEAAEVENEAESGGESEGAADAAAQHADCLKVGIDATVTPNVQYDDQTGACSLDTGTDNGGD